MDYRTALTSSSPAWGPLPPAPAPAPSASLGEWVAQKEQTIDLERVAHLAFTLTPERQGIAYGLLRTLYHNDKSSLVITAGIHQNGPTDGLHMSAKLHIGPRAFQTIHIYGWLKNGFQITRIEAYRSDLGIAEVVATFTPSPAQSGAASVRSEE